MPIKGLKCKRWRITWWQMLCLEPSLCIAILCRVSMRQNVNKQTRQKRIPIPTNAEIEQMLYIVCTGL